MRRRSRTPIAQPGNQASVDRHARIGQGCGFDLDRYLDPAGEAHTFLDPGSGTWNEAHPDVTAVVGLALVSARGARDRIERLRSTI